MVLAWTIADVRYRFRVRTAPLPLLAITFYAIGTVRNQFREADETSAKSSTRVDQKALFADGRRKSARSSGVPC